MMESMVSFVSRLAESHLLSVGTLVEKVLAPALGKDYLIKGKGSRFYDYAIELNAFGNQANDFANVLSMLIGIESIHQLSLLSLKDAFSSRNVFAKTKRWCPLCLEEWKRTGDIIYEPLIWCFKPVNICAKHNVLLSSICPNCANTLPFLTPASRNGFCSCCGCWLGSSDSVTLDANLEAVSWEYYKVKSLGAVISNEQRIRYALDNIFKLINNLGGVSSFSRKLDIPKSTVSTWIGGEHRPSLDALLKISYAFGIEILDLFNLDQSLEFLNLYTTNTPMCTSCERNKAARKLNWVSIERKLRDLIENQDLYPLSIRESARKIGCNERLLYNHFPGLCNQIAENRRRFLKLAKNNRLEEHRKIIIEATIALYNYGVYPSERKVESLIVPGLSLRRTDNYAAWKDALQIIIQE